MPLCLHFGSGGAPAVAPEAPFTAAIALFGLNSQMCTVDLVNSRIFERFPGLKVALSEGGIGWMPYILERSDYTWERHRYYTGMADARRPSEIFRSNIYGCFIYDDAGLHNIDRIGVDNVMFESDYPHSDCNWPYTRKMLEESLRLRSRRRRSQDRRGQRPPGLQLPPSAAERAPVGPAARPPAALRSSGYTAAPVDLASILELEEVGDDQWRAWTPPGSMRSDIFGGQVAGQALRAASLTVVPEHLPNSLHGYFLRRGQATLPIDIHVERTRAGRTYTSRRVDVRQEGKTIFAMLASFHADEPGREFDHEMARNIPDPDSLSPAAGSEWHPGIEVRTVDAEGPVGAVVGSDPAAVPI